MSPPCWDYRPARHKDRALLEHFSCADPDIFWQLEVEKFIQTQLHEWAFDPHAKEQDPRLLLLFERRSRDLVGVAAHEKTTLQYGNGPPFFATKLEVLAIASRWQGRSFASRERVSDVLMSGVLTDIQARVPPRAARVFAVIHEENARSIALCRRHGFTAELSRAHPSYRRLITP